jgi:hypothetical protein
MDGQTPRQMRLSSTVRGVIIGLLLAVYAWLTQRPGVSLGASLLIAAGLQGLILLLRKFVPPDRMPGVVWTLEVIADGATVFLFALGVYGGMFRFAETF